MVDFGVSWLPRWHNMSRTIARIWIPGGSQGPLEFRSFFLLIFELFGMPFG